MDDGLTVRTLAAVLHETEHALLARVLKVLGQERCVALLAEALLCEHEGGMWLEDGSRRRMLGGLFLQMIKEHTTTEEKRKVFG